jgi:hypothetical protein
VLLIADAGDGFLDVAMRAQKAGHQVKTFIRRYDAVKRRSARGSSSASRIGGHGYVGATCVCSKATMFT